jgi:hypothetical protein
MAYSYGENRMMERRGAEPLPTKRSEKPMTWSRIRRRAILRGVLQGLYEGVRGRPAPFEWPKRYKRRGPVNPLRFFR